MNTSKSMNTSKGMNTSRSKKKRVLYFNKHHSSLSDILQAASYKRRIKELLKNNKSLANTVQDAKYKIADQLKEIEGHAQTTLNISHAQLKLKDMASSIQKLVCDLQEVQQYLDVDQKKNMFDSMDRRIRIQVPDHSVIEESASRTTLEVDTTVAEDRTPSRSLELRAHPTESLSKSRSPIAVESVRSPLIRDDEITEIYDHNATLFAVGSVAKDLSKPQEGSNSKDQVTENSVSIPIQSLPKPIIEPPKPKLPGKLEAFLQNYRESPRKPLQVLNSGPLGKNTSANTTSNPFVSKIPKPSKTQAPQQQDENVKPVELQGDIANRRDTFVVPPKPCSDLDVFATAADRRGRETFVVPPKLCTVQDVFATAADHRGRETFVVPPKPCSVSDVFATAADRRGTFVINSSEVNKLQIDRRETYVVPPGSVAQVQEDSVATTIFEDPVPAAKCGDSVVANDFAEPVPSSEFPNQTILLNEDMELTEVVPTRKPWTDEATEIVPPAPVEKKTERVFPKQTEDVELTKMLLNHPIANSPIDTEECEDEIFVKPCAVKSNRSPQPVLPSKVSPEQRERSSASLEENKTSRKSSVKRKKSHDIDPPEQAKKGRASKRKSVAPKRASSRKSVLPKDPEIDFWTDPEDDPISDISISSSSSPCKRKTRGKKSVKYFEDASFETAPEKDAPVGRRVIDFFETRKSLVPNKRTFIFTSKKGNAGSASTDQGSAVESTKQKEEDRVFEFTASDSEDQDGKSKKTKKRSKKVDSTSQSAKESKKPHLEKVSLQPLELPTEITTQHKSKPVSEIVASDTQRDSLSLTSPDDSFVIGVEFGKINKVKELVNSKGERITLESSKPSSKSIKTSAESLNKAGSKPTSKGECGAVVSSSYKLTTPPIAQGKEKSLSQTDYSPGTSSDEPGKTSCESQSSTSSKATEGRSSRSRSSKLSEGLSSRSSKLSENRGRKKRPFSGVSERRSKKKSTMEPPDFLDEFNSPINLEGPPKGMELNSDAFGFDCEMTEVYNFKDVVPAKVQEDESRFQEQVFREKQTKQQLDALGDKFEEQKQVPKENATKQKAVIHEEKSKNKEQVSNEKLIQPSAKLPKEKSSSKEDNLFVKQVQHKTKVLEEKSKNKDDMLLEKQTKLKEKVVEEKSRSKEDILIEKKIKQKPKDQEEKSKNKEQASNEKLVHPIAKVIEEISKAKDDVFFKLQIKQNSKVQEEKSKNKDLRLLEKQVQLKGKVPEDISKNNDELPVEKETQLKTKVLEEKSQNSETVSNEKKIQQKIKAQENKFKSQEHKSKGATSETEKSAPSTSKSKECYTEKTTAVKLSSREEPSTKTNLPTAETLTSAAKSDHKRNRTTREHAKEVIKTKHDDPSVSKVVTKVLPKTDVLCSTDVAAPSSQSDKHKSSKHLNSEKIATASEKHKEESAKVAHSAKSKSTLNDKEAAGPSADKSNTAVPDTISKFNRADFDVMNLDDLTNNDFVSRKTKKLFRESKVVADPLKEKQPKSKTKKPRSEKLNPKENKVAVVKESIGTDLNPRASKDGHNLDENFPPATATDAIPVHRQNCSGSIGSLCSTDSKGNSNVCMQQNEGRASRRNRGTKSYKEPSLHSKMRR